MAGATSTVVIDCTQSDFYSVITDYEKYPEFLPDMEEVRVVSRDGHAVDAHFTLNLVKELKYVLRLVETEAQNGLEWTLVEGPFKRNNGTWTLTDAEGGKTHASYSIEVSVDVFLPGTLVNRLVGQTLPATLKAFKERAEALHGPAA
ncbi:MAG: SRPBCC family protein [Proteobacteria bacterium]|nr:SRPBCC family protein [Pseudomonadota bacterium]